MLAKKIKEYLKAEEIEKNPKEIREQIENALKKENINIESSFSELMIKYDEEFEGSEGLMINVGYDLLEYETSLTKHFRDHYKIAIEYLPLFNLETDDFLFYNKNNDTVTLVEAEDINLFNENKIKPTWKSFDKFLKDFFELE